jgi:FlaA1/EpsC-like NDP-sugar epimerase
MERHPSEAVLNNVVGTRNIFDAAEAHGANASVFISTDKAVYPSSVMGATKRIGELYVRALSADSGGRFVVTRFGNVLGSNGSVIPIFIDQIQRGGPVTVTHAEMKRFFMSIPEACHLVLQAAACGFGGDLFVLEMGMPIRILDLAERLIERSGLRPGVDIEVVFSGPRPGEKLSEQLTLATEIAKPSPYPGIWRVSADHPPLAEVTANLDELEQLALANRDGEVLELLAELVPEYHISPEARALSSVDDREDDEEELPPRATPDEIRSAVT